MAAFPPRTILVAFDFSEGSRAAWRYAKALADSLGARSIEAVHVTNYFESPTDLLHADLSAAELEDERSRLRRSVPDADVVRVVEGAVRRGILAAAEESRADLLVAGTTGRAGIERLERRSTAEDLARHSPIPVLSVRARAGPPLSILAPVCLEAHSLEGLRVARVAARALKGRVTALYVDEGGDPARRQAALRRKLRVLEGNAVARILEEARRHDLIVLVSRRRGALRDALLGTTAERVLRRAPIPVLCVPEAGVAPLKTPP